jgi:endonuclease III
MKNSKAYANKIQKLYRSLARKYPKVQSIDEIGVTDSIIYAIVSSDMSEKSTTSAVKRLGEHFVDWNDLRVARTEEIVDVLKKDTNATKATASTLLEVLNDIFNKYHKVDLEALKKVGKRPAKTALEKIEGISHFAIDYCMLTALKGHAIPITEKMIEYLKSNELVDPDADEQQISGFLAKQIPAKNGYEFYSLLRQDSEAGTTKKTRKVAKKTRKKAKTTKKKTVKKTKTKKTVRKKKTVRRKKA